MAEILGGIVSIIFMIIIFVGGIYIYLLPTTLAYKKWHRNKNAIYITNVFLGWTMIGWIACLIWVLYEEKDKKVVINTSDDKKYENLERLQKLKDSGTITEVEFEIEKQKLLK